MGLPAFDTHAYVKRLKLAGFTDAQAEAQSELQAEVLSSLFSEKLATKDDILRTTNQLKQDIAALSAETKQDISHLKIDMLKWVIGIAFTQTALILSVLKFFH